MAARLRFGLMMISLLGELLLPASLDYRRGMGRAQWVAEAFFPNRLWGSTGSSLPSTFSSTSFGAQPGQIKKNQSGFLERGSGYVFLDVFVDQRRDGALLVGNSSITCDYAACCTFLGCSRARRRPFLECMRLRGSYWRPGNAS